jgi:predicted esterase
MAGQSQKAKEEDPNIFIIEPTTKHTYSFVLLHGLGSNGEKFGTELLETGKSSNGESLKDLFPGARFIFPTAKKRRSSAFRRSKITQWFDIASLEDPAHRKETQDEGLMDSAETILKIIMKEVQELSPDRIVLGGLSHGCAMSLSLLLCLNFPLAAFVGMSGWLPFQEDLMQELENRKDKALEEGGVDEIDPFSESIDEDLEMQNDSILRSLTIERDLLGIDISKLDIKAPLLTPIFIGHGEADEKIKPALGEGMAKALKCLGMDVTWKSYEGQGHWYKIPDEIDDVFDFLKSKTGVKGVKIT